MAKGLAAVSVNLIAGTLALERVLVTGMRTTARSDARLDPTAAHEQRARTLEANLRAMSTLSPDASAAIEAAISLMDDAQLLDAMTAGDDRVIRFFPTADGVLSAEVLSATGASARSAVALASRRRPVSEGAGFADALDLTKAAVIVVGGFGAGYHVREAARRAGTHGLVVVFEPDIRLLRSVLEHIDHSAWLGSTNIRILCDAEDRASMSHAVRGAETLVGFGVQLVEHGPSRARLGSASAVFHERFKAIVDSSRMQVLTSLVQVKQTLRNITQNVRTYCTSPGIGEWAGVWTGRPAIVIAAGPSLARNMHQLKRPEVGEACVLIAVQTVLKPLLEAGIKPHIVTALDYSDLSRRFYEGLSARDVEGITLVVEPKVNPAVLEAWPGGPGSVRVTGDGNLDLLLGGALAGDKGNLTPGSTVAHLAYYLARHVGADPVALIGQDLGFTDGQYYSDKAAIHNVWAGELNSFNTLETLEWQRIVRMGEHLRRAHDIDGRPIFSDAQMTTYLSQFERDFKTDQARGLCVIDASEGGVRKQHTQVLSLAEFIDQHVINADRLPNQGLTPGSALKSGEIFSPSDLSAVQARLRDVRQQVWRVGQCSKRAESLLKDLLDHFHDRARVDRGLDELDTITKEVVDLEPGYSLTQTLTQIGAFNRLRSDRAISMESTLSPLDRQKRQIERDLANVANLATTAEQLGELLHDASATLSGARCITRELPVFTNAHPAPSTHRSEGAHAAPARRFRVAVIVPVSDDTSIDRLVLGIPVLVRTLRRVLGARRAAMCAVLTDRPIKVQRVIDEAGMGGMIRVVPANDAGALGRRHRLIACARLASAACWRGGIGGASAFDVAFEPANLLVACEQLDVDAAALIAPEWALIDPSVIDQTIDRIGEDPEGLRMAFTHAPPGMGTCVIHRELLRQVAPAAGGGLRASIGSLLGYNAQAPVNDLIASARCVNVPDQIRDLGVSLAIGDDADLRQAERLIRSIGEGADMTAIARYFASTDAHDASQRGPSEVVAWLGSPIASGPRALARAFAIGAASGHSPGTLRPISIETLVGLVQELRGMSGRVPLITLGSGHDEPLDPRYADLAGLISALRRLEGTRVHVRTPLSDVSDSSLDAMLQVRPDVVSVDLLADSAKTYLALTGLDASAHARVRSRLERVIEAGRRHADSPMLVVVRMTRCDGAYEDVETFYHRWMSYADGVVLDALPAERMGERIRPLSLPASARNRMDRERLLIDEAGRVLVSATSFAETDVVGIAGEVSTLQLWNRVVSLRSERRGAGK